MSCVSALIKSWVVLVFASVAGMGAANAATWHVDAKRGDDANSGQSTDAPFLTLQKAANLVRPGDTVIVGEGVYFERVRIDAAGTPDQPIVFKAADRGLNKVVVTGADPAVRLGQAAWRLEDQSLGLYSVPFGHEPARALYSGTDLLPYPTLEALKRFELPIQLNGVAGAYMPGPAHGFAYDKDAGRLYVRLHASNRYGPPDPSMHVMAVGSVGGVGSAGNGIARPDHYNIGVLTEGPAHVVIDGFTFETPGVAGVYVRGSDVTVQHCWFRGCRAGVSGKAESSDHSQTSNRVTVAYCDYSQFPAFDDVLEVIRRYPDGATAKMFKYFWWHRKGRGVGNHNTYETGIVNLAGQDWAIEHNYIHDAFEGMSCWAIRWSDRLTVRGNIFERIVDNAVETEDHASNVSIHDNLIFDTFEPLSWQPLGGLPWPGPIYIYRNIIRNDPVLNQMWARAGHTPGWFKAGASQANWDADWNREKMRGVPGDVVRPPGDGVVVFNNTVIFPNGDFLTRTQPLERAYENFHFVNNICQAAGFSNGEEFTGSRMAFDYNVWVGDPSSTDPRASVFAGTHGQVLPSVEALGLLDPASAQFSPQPGSPVIGAAGPVPIAAPWPGVSTNPSDVGAVPSGQIAPAPRVGPQSQSANTSSDEDQARSQSLKEGKVLFTETFENLGGWHLEGMQDAVTIITPSPGKPGQMRLACKGSMQGGVGVMAFLKQDFPDNIALEYDLAVETHNGLLITLLALKGINGEDAITGVPPRRGVFSDYVGNDAPTYSYHVSVCRYDDQGEHTGVSNWRRNPGAHLMVSGKDLCTDTNRPYRVRIIKQGPLCRIEVDGELGTEFVDPQELAGPIPTDGKIGFRAIGSDAVFRISNLRVTALEPEESGM